MEHEIRLCAKCMHKIRSYDKTRKRDKIIYHSGCLQEIEIAEAEIKKHEQKHIVSYWYPAYGKD